MSDMPMPGGWTMSMMWMRMPGQSWPGAAAAFVTMWTVMMTVMMLPSLTPMLRRYRQAVGRPGATRLACLTTIVAVAYFCIWSVFGIATFPVGAVLASLTMRHLLVARVVPFAVSAVVLVCGVFQFSAWKARYLACCRHAPEVRDEVPPEFVTAWRHGVRLGLQCGSCSANLMLILMAVGVMDVRAMVVITAAITAERLAPSGDRVARAIGSVAVGSGLFMIYSACR